MSDLTEKSLEEAVLATNGKPLSVTPTHIVWRHSDLDDPRNLAKFLRAKRTLRDAEVYKSKRGGFSASYDQLTGEIVFEE